MSAPELPSDALRTPALAAVRKLLQTTGLDGRKFSSSSWNPLGEIISGRDRVLIKPNWVHHENDSGADLDCLVTHATILGAVLEYVARAQPESIVVGDAPIQSCDFPLLRSRTGLDSVFERARRRGIPVRVEDFRLVTMQGRRWGGGYETVRNADQYVLFDLGIASFLEPISSGSPRFRVTMYDPRALESAHGKGRHRYLVAREVMDSTVVINLPKLKTHKKSCITGVLKNMVGINGHKSYLPHHRRGGSADGGDCYSGRGLAKSLSEEFLDRANGSSPGFARRLSAIMARVAMRCGRASDGSSFNVEGSWHGNDTVWRTVLDLQRILHFGRADATVATSQQRIVINLTDAIIGGQGDGPLSPTPAKLGFLTLGTNSAATEWVNASLMGLDPARIPLTSAAFSKDEPTLANFQPNQIKVRLEDVELSPEVAAQRAGYAVIPPAGWVGHCEWQALQGVRV